MPDNGNLGIVLVYTYAGNPTGVSTQAFNPPKGSLVIDTVTPAVWLKTSLSDNSTFIGGAGNALTTPLITAGLTASGSAANDFSGSTGAFKTSTGINTLGGSATNITGTLAVKVVNTPVAAAGSTNADAAALTTASIQHVSSDSAAKGVILPTSVAGYSFIIINDSSTACEVYPDAGGNVNGQTTTSGSVTIPASKGVIATCTVALTWIVFDLAAKSS